MAAQHVYNQNPQLLTLQRYLDEFSFETEYDLRIFASYIKNDLAQLEPIPQYFPAYLRREIFLIQTLVTRISSECLTKQKEEITHIFFTITQNFAKRITDMSEKDQFQEVTRRQRFQEQKERRTQTCSIMAAGVGH